MIHAQCEAMKSSKIVVAHVGKGDRFVETHFLDYLDTQKINSLILHYLSLLTNNT